MNRKLLLSLVGASAAVVMAVGTAQAAPASSAGDVCAAMPKTIAPSKTCVGTATATTAAGGTMVIGNAAGSATVARGRREEVRQHGRCAPRARAGLLPLLCPVPLLLPLLLPSSGVSGSPRRVPGIRRRPHSPGTVRAGIAAHASRGGGRSAGSVCGIVVTVAATSRTSSKATAARRPQARPPTIGSRAGGQCQTAMACRSRRTSGLPAPDLCAFAGCQRGSVIADGVLATDASRNRFSELIGSPARAMRSTAPPDRFNNGGHVMGIGVQQHEAIRHDADVALPEHQIAALEPVEDRRRFAALWPSSACCMSLSRGQSMPAACKATCTSPEQSTPSASCRPTDRARRRSAPRRRRNRPRSGRARRCDAWARSCRRRAWRRLGPCSATLSSAFMLSGSQGGALMSAADRGTCRAPAPDASAALTCGDSAKRADSRHSRRGQLHPGPSVASRRRP